jgi:transposase
MTYVVKQKIKGRTYAYEVQSYWDPDKKQARQKRRYLGIWDEETGQIIPKTAERDVTAAKSFGPAYLLDELGKEISIRKKLKDAFGKDGDVIYAMAMAKLIYPTSLKNLHHVVEDSYIPEMYALKDSFSSQWLSTFFERLASKDTSMLSFYNSLTQTDDETLIFDITSLSSFSKNINWLEYGYNRDGIDLPQVNLGLVTSVHRQIPLYFKLFPGSVNDVTTLKNLIAEVKSFGISKSLFILDRGFYSESNVVEMASEGIDFIMPLPFGVKIGKGLISETNREIENPAKARIFGGRIYYVMEDEVDIGGVKAQAYVFLNKHRESSEVSSFYRRLIDIETRLDGKKAYREPHELFKRTAGNFARYFEWEVVDGLIRLRRRVNAISQAVNRFGKTIILSATPRSWDEVLSLYKERDLVEKQFDELKNELDVMPLRVQKVETLQGLLFVFFVSLVMRALLLRKAREAGLLDKRSVEDILLEMGKLRTVKVGGIWRLTEITKRIRMILEKIGVQVPIEPGHSY